MSKRDQQRKQADRDFEEIRQAIASLSDHDLCEALLDVPHRKWIEIEKDTHMAVGILAHRAAQRIAELTTAPADETNEPLCKSCNHPQRHHFDDGHGSIRCRSTRTCECCTSENTPDERETCMEMGMQPCAEYPGCRCR